MFGKNKDNPQNDEPEDPKSERRHSQRIAKNFIMTYYELKQPQLRNEITQLRNISTGGMSFVSSRKIAEGSKLGIDLKTPYFGSKTYLEGTVVGCHEKVGGIIYETRLQFVNLHPDAEFLLKKLIEFFVKGEGKVYDD